MTIRRRREWLECEKRYTTYERPEEGPLIVIKKDGRREPFDCQIILAGLLTACEKRPVSFEKIEKLVTGVEQDVRKQTDNEIPSAVIGELVMERLKELDEVAYVRFASVYRQFKDLDIFMEELHSLLKAKKQQ